MFTDHGQLYTIDVSSTLLSPTVVAKSSTLSIISKI